jgi:hypothetical protein
VLAPAASNHKDFHSSATIVVAPLTVNPGPQIVRSGTVSGKRAIGFLAVESGTMLA